MTEPIPLPCCPHCGEELSAVAAFQWPTPHSQTLAIYCPHEACRKVLTMQIVLVADAPVIDAEPTRIRPV